MLLLLCTIISSHHISVNFMRLILPIKCTESYTAHGTAMRYELNFSYTPHDFIVIFGGGYILELDFQSFQHLHQHGMCHHHHWWKVWLRVFLPVILFCWLLAIVDLVLALLLYYIIVASTTGIREQDTQPSMKNTAHAYSATTRRKTGNIS
jgi:hypothetical protein